LESLSQVVRLKSQTRRSHDFIALQGLQNAIKGAMFQGVQA